MEKIIKIGSVELTESEAEKLHTDGKYIVTYSKIYQLFWSNAQKCVYGNVIYTQKGMTKRGRYFAMTGAAINDLLGFELVNA